ncbi:TIGR04282 family arsenosugar biosynthesis glycosyltransferase [Phormidesmis sp. 146-12]
MSNSTVSPLDSETPCLIIFTRYPEPGKAKTRLIPALGPQGAAALHRQMTEQTLTEVRHLQTLRPVAVEVRFSGSDLFESPARGRDQMQAWLGKDLSYSSQHSGDLGDRLSQAFQSAFDRSAKSVIAIGTDCPDLDASILAIAFEKLQTHDLVLGAATDGGYYLIGLRHFMPDLFVGVAWSTAIVLQQTVAIAEKLGCSIAYLPVLSDVDRPEDLKPEQREV